jgi:zinc-ribbon domain
MTFCSNCGQQLTVGTEKFCPNCGQDLMKGGIRGGEAGSGTVNVIQQELANIQHPEYAKALKDFSENINRHLKGRQIPKEQVISINTSLEELAKEVQGVKPGKEEQQIILTAKHRIKNCFYSTKNIKCSTRSRRRNYRYICSTSPI